ncbi:MAG: HepT-like ribonuclease domain-containing protein [Nodosilinea sp.]
MEIEVQRYLYDIQVAGKLIQSFIAAQTFDSYRADDMLRSAVERQFITIGEALNQAIRRSPDLEGQIAEARKIVDFRNLLTHSYGAVSDAVVWDIIQTSLPRLISNVDALMETS